MGKTEFKEGESWEAGQGYITLVWIHMQGLMFGFWVVAGWTYGTVKITF
jgi:hypothetical protein